jgi:hypothetical protein
VKKPRAKPIYAFAIKTSAGLDVENINVDRAELVRYANKPAGQSVVPIRISEISKPPKSRP